MDEDMRVGDSGFTPEDPMITIGDLGMTEGQAVMEILFMREWDEFLRSRIGEELYNSWIMIFARQAASEDLRNMGASEEEVEAICDNVDCAWKDGDERE